MSISYLWHPPKISLNCLCPAMLPLLKMSGQLQTPMRARVWYRDFLTLFKEGFTNFLTLMWHGTYVLYPADTHSTNSLSGIPGPLCTPFLWQQDLGCSFLCIPEQAASPKTECSCLLLILLVRNPSAALVGNGTGVLSACVWWIFPQQVLSSAAAGTTPLGTPHGPKVWSWLSISQVQSFLSREYITVCVASKLV